MTITNSGLRFKSIHYCRFAARPSCKSTQHAAGDVFVKESHAAVAQEEMTASGVLTGKSGKLIRVTGAHGCDYVGRPTSANDCSGSINASACGKQVMSGPIMPAEVYSPVPQYFTDEKRVRKAVGVFFGTSRPQIPKSAVGVHGIRRRNVWATAAAKYAGYNLVATLIIRIRYGTHADMGDIFSHIFAVLARTATTDKLSGL